MLSRCAQRRTVNKQVSAGVKKSICSRTCLPPVSNISQSFASTCATRCLATHHIQHLERASGVAAY